MLVYKERFATMEQARAREKQIKSWKGGNAFRKFIRIAAGSSNGRTPDSGSGNPGSSPGPAVMRGNKIIKDKFGGANSPDVRLRRNRDPDFTSGDARFPAFSGINWFTPPEAELW